MDVESKEARHWPPPLAGRLQAGASVGQVADTIVAIWLETDQTLHPIIGHRGVAALYNRSLKLTGAAYPWLTADHQHLLTAVDLTALRTALAQRDAGEAAAGGSALFLTFHDLLASLVGASLTTQLLEPVWARPAIASPPQDTPR